LIERQHGCEQAAGIFMLRVCKQLFNRALFNLPARAEHQHAIGKMLDDAEIVRYEQE
jgi:hypothetical protein